MLCTLPDGHGIQSRIKWTSGAAWERCLPAIPNQLIARLPRRDRIRFLAGCDEVELAMSQVLCESGAASRHAYFPSRGYISLVTPIDGKPVLEVGMVGNEGMLGTQLALGVAMTPLFAVVQGAGMAWRMSAAAFRRELIQSKPLKADLDRYVQVTMIQLASSAACLRFHQIGPRLARWLLMTQDRAHADSFHVTHEFLAFMLGVRRVGVTTAAVALHRRGLIDYRRGDITVVDRGGLEAAACTCYAADRRAYVDVMH